jgi:hypothetical protein
MIAKYQIIDHYDGKDEKKLKKKKLEGWTMIRIYL